MSPRKHDVPDELLGRLLANDQKPEDLIGENGPLKQLTQRLVEKARDAEMTEHLGHEKHAPVANAAGNTRNGRSRKTLKGEFGELPIGIPRDRDGTFEPKRVSLSLRLAWFHPEINGQDNKTWSRFSDMDR